MSSAKQEGSQFKIFKLSGVARSYFGVVATLILLIVLILLIYPAVQHVTKINREISDARIVKATLEAKLANLDIARANLEEVREDLFVLDLALPIGSDLTPYLKDLGKMAKNSKLKISAVQFSDVPLSKPSTDISSKTKQIDYTIAFEGSFPNFRKFLAKLESFIRTSDVTNISIVKEPEEPLTHTLGVSSYYLGADSAPSPQTTGIQETIPENLEGFDE